MMPRSSATTGNKPNSAERRLNKAWPGASDAQAAVFYEKTCNIDPTRGCFEAGELMEDGRVAAREGEIEGIRQEVAQAHL